MGAGKHAGEYRKKFRKERDRETSQQCLSRSKCPEYPDPDGVESLEQASKSAGSISRMLTNMGSPALNPFADSMNGWVQYPI